MTRDEEAADLTLRLMAVREERDWYQQEADRLTSVIGDLAARISWLEDVLHTAMRMLGRMTPFLDWTLGELRAWIESETSHEACSPANDSRESGNA